MPLYVEKPRDTAGYRHYPPAVIEARDDRNNGFLYLKELEGFGYHKVPKVDFQCVSKHVGPPRLIKKPLQEAWQEMDALIKNCSRSEFALF